MCNALTSIGDTKQERDFEGSARQLAMAFTSVSLNSSNEYPASMIRHVKRWHTKRGVISEKRMGGHSMADVLMCPANSKEVRQRAKRSPPTRLSNLE